MGVNVAAHTRHIFLGSSPPPGVSQHKALKEYLFNFMYHIYYWVLCIAKLDKWKSLVFVQLMTQSGRQN